MAANWITGEVFAWMNQSGEELAQLKVTPRGLAALLDAAAQRGDQPEHGQERAGRDAAEREERRGDHPRAGAGAGLGRGLPSPGWCSEALEANPDELAKYLAGKETLANWFYGQVMRAAKGKANPPVVQAELERQLRQKRVKYSMM